MLEPAHDSPAGEGWCDTKGPTLHTGRWKRSLPRYLMLPGAVWYMEISQALIRSSQEDRRKLQSCPMLDLALLNLLYRGRAGPALMASH